jgi:hypothetical protein
MMALFDTGRVVSHLISVAGLFSEKTKINVTRKELLFLL